MQSRNAQMSKRLLGFEPQQRVPAALALLPGLGALLGLAVMPLARAQAVPATLASVAVASSSTAQPTAYDGVVEAVRQTIVAARVPGAVVTLAVKAGERVRSGQVLVRLDARAAEQHAGAAAAQVQAARAALDVAAKELQRQQQLFGQNFISGAALDRAEAQYKSAQAQATAQVAAADAARTESGFHTVRAPYDGVVAEVAVVLGDMAMPGRALLTLYDPGALRVSAAVPQTAAPRAAGPSATALPAPPLAEVPGAAGERLTATRWQVLPAADPATHTVTLRLDLPAGTGAVPGMFARVWLAGRADADASRLSVPAKAVLRRAELTAVYVLAPDGKPLLRQVRLGRHNGEQVEVLSGLGAGERVALDPQAAARLR